VPNFQTTRRVKHSARQMFDLVADVEKYPRFVPLCESLAVRSRVAEAGREVLIAVMSVAYRFLRETFTSRVITDRNALTIQAEYLDGPFHHLDNIWRFEPVSDKECVVHFSIDYEFRSRALAAVMGVVFDSAFRRFTDAFEKRADEVYGT
jgi:coenzyme Q-binding protein COQ10